MTTDEKILYYREQIYIDTHFRIVEHPEGCSTIMLYTDIAYVVIIDIILHGRSKLDGD